MAKLVDALVSGTSVSNDVQVRVLFWAQSHLAQMVKLVDTPAWGAGARKVVQVRVLFWALKNQIVVLQSGFFMAHLLNRFIVKMLS